MFVLETSLDYNECHHVVGVFSTLAEAQRQADADSQASYENQWITEFALDNLQPVSKLFRRKPFEGAWDGWK